MLTPRELQILHYISHGETNPAIALRCNLSENTIKTHVRHMFKKLKVRNRIHAVRRAAELGLFHHGPLPEQLRNRPRPETPLAEALRQTDPGKQLVAALVSLGWTPPGHV